MRQNFKKTFTDLDILTMKSAYCNDRESLQYAHNFKNE